MTPPVTQISFEGSLTVDRIRELHEDLRQALAAAEHLDIDVARADHADLTFLQLLCSAHRTALATGKTVSLCGNLSDAFCRAVADNGFARQSGCGNEIDRTCLWRTNLAERQMNRAEET